ncbi:hypothetical protein Bca4012_041275 [Brassica carinata]
MSNAGEFYLKLYWCYVATTWCPRGKHWFPIAFGYYWCPAQQSNRSNSDSSLVYAHRE